MWCLIVTKRPMCSKKSLKLIKDRMLSPCLHQILTIPSESCSCKSRQHFFDFPFVQFWWTCENCRLNFLFLAERRSIVVIFLGCSDWFFELLFSFCHLEPVCPFSSDTHQYGHMTDTHHFYFFGPSSGKKTACINPDQQFLEPSNPPIRHQTTYHARIHLNAISSPFCCSV